VGAGDGIGAGIAGADAQTLSTVLGDVGGPTLVERSARGMDTSRAPEPPAGLLESAVAKPVKSQKPVRATELGWLGTPWRGGDGRRVESLDFR
jgi:hypothetical protein